MLALFGLTLGLFEIIFFAAFILLLIIGVSFDRRGKEEPKWYIFGIGFIALATWFWPDWTFFGSATVPTVMDGTKVVTEAHTRVVLWDAIRSWTFWEPMAAYLAAGLVYAIVEFIFSIRRAARDYAAKWEERLGSNFFRGYREIEGGGRIEEAVNLREALKRAEAGDAEMKKLADENISAFIRNNAYRNQIVELVQGEDGKPEPKVNKVELAEHIGAWTFFWPFYLLSLILGDLLTEVFNIVAEFFVSLSGRFVRMSFKDVFKF